MKTIPESGTGLIYFSGMESLIESLSSLIQVIETEPQTSWLKTSLESDSYTYDQGFTDFLNAQPQPKIFHGVGFPVGGSIVANEAHFQTLNAQIHAVQPLYTSEHLSFNQFYDAHGSVQQTNFLLPPLQNEQGVAAAVAAIQSYKNAIELPFAFETGTNYLQPRKGEMPDGAFVAQIAEKSDSYILLDLHNLLANELNGRQSVKEFMSYLPLERIVEIHLAGGMYFNRYYLDAHSGISSPELMELTQSIIRQLPCLKSIIFEMLPEYLDNGISEKEVAKQLIAMNRLWDQRGKAKQQKPLLQYTTASSTATVQEWEQTLGTIANSGEALSTSLYQELKADPGTEIICRLIFEFRASAIVSTLKMSTRLIRLTLGNERFKAILHTYCSTHASELSGVGNALRFSEYLQQTAPDVPYLKDLLSFEMKAIATHIDGQFRTVDFEYDPYPLFEDLVERRKPGVYLPAANIYRLEIKPDADTAEANEVLKYNPVFHN